MRRIALASLLLALTAPRLAAGTFSDLRAAHPSVDLAISRLPSNGITGTLSHISSLLDQPRVTGLGPAGSDRLPAGFNRQMTGALDRLADELSAGLPQLSIADRLIIAQVLDEVVIERNATLYGGAAAPCRDCPRSPADSLAPVVDLLAGSIRGGIADWTERYGLGLSDAGAASNLPVAAQSFDPWLDTVVDNCAILGVEHIDH